MVLDIVLEYVAPPVFWILIIITMFWGLLFALVAHILAMDNKLDYIAFPFVVILFVAILCVATSLIILLTMVGACLVIFKS